MRPIDSGTIGVMRLAAAARSWALVWGLLACAIAAAEQAPDATPTTRDEAQADAAQPFWRLAYSPYTYHFSNDSAHHPVSVFGAERQRADGFLLGAAYFRNSFDQPSAYAFVGQRIDHWISDRMFLYWSAGVLYGYKGAYAHKVPLNFHGFSPGAIGAVGWQFSPQWSTQVNLLGTAGLMFQVSRDLR